MNPDRWESVLPPGKRLGPYEIERLIGAGGMGHVYQARDSRLRRTIAIKVLPPDVAADPEAVHRFEREARTISALNHPNICALYDIGEADGRLFLVMEYLEGDSLAARLSSGRLTSDEAVCYARQIAGALEHAHQHGIVHRDLKPANVVLTKNSEGSTGSPQAKLLDFGIAKLYDDPGLATAAAMTASVTQEGYILGTLAAVTGGLLFTQMRLASARKQLPEAWQKAEQGKIAEAESSFASATFDQLTNQPGEEYSPSLSPDGRSLVYASRAAGNWDIFLQRVGGQNRVNLTTDSEADDTQPALSPAGDYIAFRSDRDGGGIFVMGATGESVRRLTDFGYDPAWSPDGTELVFSSVGFDIPSARGSVGELWRVLTSTGEVRRVKTDVGDAVQPSWSPLGSRLAFWSIRSTSATTVQRDVWTVDASGGSAIRVTGDAALDWNPVWSPDGRYLYFASDRGGSMNFWRVRIDEATGKVLDEPRPVTRGGGVATRQSLSFSRDGRRMAFVERIARSNIQRLAFASTRGTSVGRPEWITQGSRQATMPAPSPDGGWVLFSTIGGPPEDVFIVRPDGTGERQLTNDRAADRRPRWSPDGSRFAFYSNRITGRYQIWSARPDGSELELIVENERSVIHPSWSPDGSRVAYYTGGEFSNFISTIGTAKTSERLPEIGHDRVFGVNDWSPDGKRLAGAVLDRRSSTNNSNGVAIYSLESGVFEQLTEFGWAPVWLADSRRLLFPYQDRIYIVDSSSGKVGVVASIGTYTIRPYGLSVSGDNRWIYYAVDMNEADIWLMQLP
jgi:Tol biopolymer transport system component